MKKILVCPICDKEFVETRPGRKYCSHRCASIFANRVRREKRRQAVKKCRIICKYNNGIVCDERKCESCGWNPDVAKRRSECYGKG